MKTPQCLQKTQMQVIFRPVHECRGFILAAMVAALILSATVVSAATNVLTNPGFEAGSFSGWTTYGSHAVESTNNTYYNGGQPGGSNVLTHNGQYVGKTYGSFT